MKHALRLQIGPVGFRVGSAWRAPIDRLAALYRGYPEPDIPDFTVRLEPAKPWRRWLRPSVFIAGDFSSLQNTTGNTAAVDQSTGLAWPRTT